MSRGLQCWRDLVRVVALIFLSLGFCACAGASSLLFVKQAGADAESERRFQLAARFYGVEISTLTLSGSSGTAALDRSIKDPNVLGLVFAGGALDTLNSNALIDVLQTSRKARMPLMLITSGADQGKSLLATFTENRVTGCRSVAAGSRHWEMTFPGKSDLLHPLNGVAISSSDAPACALDNAQNPSVETLISMRSQGAVFPVLVKTTSDGQEVFVAAATPQVAAIIPGSREQLQQTFSALSVPMIFLRTIAGEKIWHLPQQDANLTIDDPWLTEPYGNLEYGALLKEMQQHHFHTTIAFVPWNFDRGQSQVIELFRSHPDLYSLSVHGNNHNHREFGAYSSQPLSVQASNVQQSVARMDQFQKTTGIPYDRVMVFPHAIAPADTFGLLAKEGFWATVNSENVPLGSRMPNDFLYPLRPWTLAFQDFLSLKRVSAEVPISMPNMAINAFLGNPLLFYIHQEYFEKGISAFDSTADAANRMAPDIHWQGLGDIVRHLYLLRLRDDGDYDVSLLSKHLQLVNPGDRRATFHLFNESSGSERFDVVLGPHESRSVDLSHADDRKSGEVDISKKSFLINLDRRLSDFRDMQLSRSHLGRMIQDVYYKQGIDHLEAVFERRMIAFAILFTGGLVLLFVIRRQKRWKPRT